MLAAAMASSSVDFRRVFLVVGLDKPCVIDCVRE
jgi:hypothetical protein